MSAFSDPAATEAVVIVGPTGATNTVTIKADADYGDQVYVQNRAVKIREVGGKPVPEMQTGDSQLAMLVVMIKGWDGPDFLDGDKPARISEANIRRLRPWASTPLLKALEPKFQGLSDAEKKS